MKANDYIPGNDARKGYEPACEEMQQKQVKMSTSKKKPANALKTVLPGFLTIILAFSCSKEKTEPVEPSTFSAKWIIDDPDSRYASFEFNKDGSYIVVEKDKTRSAHSHTGAGGRHNFPAAGTPKALTRQTSPDTNLSPIHFGAYTIDGNRITLSGFGVIDVISITAEEFNFSFTLAAAGEKETYVANKEQDPISSSSRTGQLCRTWIMEKCTIDEEYLPEADKQYLQSEYGANWKEIDEKERTDLCRGTVVLFSKAGAYLVAYDGEAGLSKWKWANANETAIYYSYSWDNWEDPDEWEENLVWVTELTETNLQMREGYILWHLTRKK